MNNWEEIKLGKYMSLKGGYAFSSNNFTEFGIPIIRISNISNKGIRPPFAYISKVNKSLFSEFELSSNDILIAMSGATTGKNCKIKKDSLPALLNQRVGKFRIIDTDNLDNEFLYYVINTEYFQNELFKDAIGGAQPNISGKQIENITVLIPQKPHQQKIAKILNTIDAVIEKTENAIGKYKAIKKGMMHDLFTRGIDVKTGQLRPSFDDAPELYKESVLGMIPKDWEINPLSKLGIIKSGIDYKSNPKGDEYPIYGTGGIMGRTSKYLNSGPAVLTGRKGTINNPLYIEGKFWNVDTIFCINSINLKEVDIKWLFYNFRNTDLTKLNEATGVPSVNSSSLYKLKFKTPLFKEQQEITLRLSKIDLLIEKEQKTLAKHQNIKKGLMQDLLTGKVEVKV